MRAVLAELQAGAGTGSIRKDPDCQVFVDKLFSVRHVEALPPGTRVVQVGPGRSSRRWPRDLLKRRGSRSGSAQPGDVAEQAAASGPSRSRSESGTMQALRRALLDGPRPWVELEPSLERSSAGCVEGTGRGAMLDHGEAALAVWKSCQVPGVRAASAVEPAEVAPRGAGPGHEPARGRAGGQVDLLDEATRRRRSGTPGAPAGARSLARQEAGDEDRRGDRPRDAVAIPPQPARGPVPDRPAHAARGLDRGLSPHAARSSWSTTTWAPGPAT